jgi:putative sterol carrier protein
LKELDKMPVFQDADHFYRVVGEFMKIPSRPRTIENLRQWWSHSPAYYENGDEVDQINKIGEKIGKSNMIIEFEIVQPNALICIDARQPKKGEHYTVYLGDSVKSPDVSVKTTGDTAHQFWGGQVSVPVALMTGKIKTNGSKKKALQLLPRITPAFALYFRYLELIGEDRLLKILSSSRKR